MRDDRRFMELQEWSREVARDPAAPAFLPLANSYRREGRHQLAIETCLRALARNPAHIEGHALLAQLYLDIGDRDRAGDEWSAILHLDPNHYAARRGLGFLSLENGDLESARRHLGVAAELRPSDRGVQEALDQMEGGGLQGSAPAGYETPAREVRPAAPAPRGAVVPGQVFEPLLSDPHCQGILIVDAGGVILAGGAREGVAERIERLAARLGGVVPESTRLLELLGSGPCQAVHIETEAEVLELLPLGDGLYLLLVIDRAAPGPAVRGLAERALDLVSGSGGLS